MSSKSSECECPMYYAYGGYGPEIHGNLDIYGESAYCFNTAQPFVYYAQMPQKTIRQQKRNDENGKRNCFAKAFRWYTKEHVRPHQDSSPTKPNAIGFANWLDTKYEEFLQDKKKTSYCEPQKRQRKFRVKSPWRRKHSAKEAGDVMQKRSCRYILKPRDLSRPASECCQRSNGTVISTEMLVRPSQSYTSTSQQGKPSFTIQEAIKALRPRKIDEKESRISLTEKDFFMESQNLACRCSISFGRTNTCRCSDAEKTNALTQYDYEPVECVCQTKHNETSSLRYQNIQKYSSPKEEPVKRYQKSVEVDARCPCIEEFTSMICSTHERKHTNVSTNSPSKMAKSSFYESDNDASTRDDGIQTSDHSIRLERDEALGCPMFMKIVFADKLSK